MASITKPLTDYCSGVGKLIPATQRAEWMSTVVEEIANRCVDCAGLSRRHANFFCARYTTVLATMKKTDDSLKRLKKGRQGFSLFGSRAAEEAPEVEEDRVKVQMQADVEALIFAAKGLGVDVDSSEALKALRAIASDS